uniref:Uncharacterized protein n=1 Tax=Panagrolaimus davidi TaxID=227884 RepID=A0A914PVD7_9BILA
MVLQKLFSKQRCSFSRTLIESSTQKLTPASPKIPVLHISAYTTEAKTALERQLSYRPSNINRLQHSNYPYDSILQQQQKLSPSEFRQNGPRGITLASSLSSNSHKQEIQSSKVQKKKKSVTFDHQDHFKVIPSRQELEEDHNNWSPNGTHRTKLPIFSYTSIYNRQTQSDSGGQASNSKKRRANDIGNNEFEAPKNKIPKLAAAGLKDVAAQGPIRNHSLNGNMMLRSNVIRSDQFLSNGFNLNNGSQLPWRPPLRNYSLNGNLKLRSNVMKNDQFSSNGFLDHSKFPQRLPRRKILLNGNMMLRSSVMKNDQFLSNGFNLNNGSQLPRRPPRRKQSSKPYYERFPRINLKDRKSHEPAQSCLDVLWKILWMPKRRTKQFESC